MRGGALSQSTSPALKFRAEGMSSTLAERPGVWGSSK
jgi:hypothetical protein